MADLSLTYTLANGTTADATEVQTNFNDGVTYINARNQASADWDVFSCAGLMTGKANLRMNGGAVGTPSISFTGDIDTGIYSTGSDTLDFSTGGTRRVQLDGNFRLHTGAYRAPNGTVSLPSFTFASATDTGVYSTGAGTLDLAAGGVRKVQIDGNMRLHSGTFRFPDGSTAAPSITFATDTDCGLSRIGADNVGLSLGGSVFADFATSGLLVKDTNADFAAQNQTNTAVYNVGGVDGQSVADNGSFTFTIQQGCMFTVQNNSQGSTGVFAASYGGTVAEIADPTSLFTPTDTDSGTNIAVFKSANSYVITVKNYSGTARTLAVNVLGGVTSATAPV